MRLREKREGMEYVEARPRGSAVASSVVLQLEGL